MSKKNCKFYVKVHDNLNGHVIAVCDADILGKTFEDDKLQIEVSERFYKGELMDKDQIIKILKNERNINAIGENIVNLCMELGAVSNDNILYINKIPHIQLVEL